MRAVGLPVGADLYALGLHAAAEVVPAPAIARLPHAPARLLGVSNVRGAVIPVADTGALLGLEPLGSAPFLLIARTQRGLLGLAASEQPKAVELGESLGDSRAASSLGLFDAGGGRVAALLDPDALLGDGEATR